MSARSPLLDYFTVEATEYVARLRAAVDSESPPAGDEFLTAARALRGSATMARLRGTAKVAAVVEGIAVRLKAGSATWSAELRKSLADAVIELRDSVERMRTSAEEDTERLGAAVLRFGPEVPDGSRNVPSIVPSIVPIASLFFDDAGPHIVKLATKPVAQLEQRLRSATRTGEVPDLETSASEIARPRGRELRALLGASIAKMGGMGRGSSAGAQAVVPIESLLYSGRSALARARQITGTSLESGRPPSQAALEELFDLLELATKE